MCRGTGGFAVSASVAAVWRRGGSPADLPPDFAGVTRELGAVVMVFPKCIWPGARQEAWEGFRAREASKPQKPANAEARARFEMV